MHEGWYAEDTTHGPVRIDTFDESRPHEGKVLGIVQAHADDMPLYSGGLVAKLIAEGYKAFLIQTTNDEKCGPGTIADAIKSNEVDVSVLADSLGIEDVFNLGYRNHRQEENSMLEQRCRLIFLFRHLQVDTVMSFHPWARWEENPDHYITGQLVESACWMAASGKDYPEQVQAGMKPRGVQRQVLLGHAPRVALQPGHRHRPLPGAEDRVHGGQQVPGAGRLPRAPAEGAAGGGRAGSCRRWATTTRPPTASTSVSSDWRRTGGWPSPTVWRTPSTTTTSRRAAPSPGGTPRGRSRPTCESTRSGCEAGPAQPVTAPVEALETRRAYLAITPDR